MLRADRITTGYGAIEAVHGVSFEVRRGELVSIIGANGAGKTALMLALAGQLPYRGEVTLGDVDMAGMPSHERARQGLLLVPEGRRIFSGLSVEENLLSGSMYPRAKKVRKQQLEVVYDLFPRLYERRLQLGDKMSGGEQQMLALGRTLMGDPAVLLLDEPSLGLAPRVVQELFATIEGLRRSNLTILLVEQNVRHCLAMSDRAYVMDQGQIVLEGKGPELLGDPRVHQAYLAGSSTEASDAVASEQAGGEPR